MNHSAIVYLVTAVTFVLLSIAAAIVGATVALVVTQAIAVLMCMAAAGVVSGRSAR